MHKIRLRRPWEKARIGNDAPIRVDVPEAEAPSEPAGNEYQYVRRFNLPTGLDDRSRVRLRIEAWTGDLNAFELNEVTLPIGPPPIDLDVTRHLMRHNKIELRLVSTDKAPVALSGEVTLSIDNG
jgi:hypothetical protein